MPCFTPSTGTAARWTPSLARGALWIELLLALFTWSLTILSVGNINTYPGAYLLLTGLPIGAVTFIVTLINLACYSFRTLHPVWTLTWSIIALLGYAADLTILGFEAGSYLGYSYYDRHYYEVNLSCGWTAIGVGGVAGMLYFSYMIVSAIAVDKWRKAKKHVALKNARVDAESQYLDPATAYEGDVVQPQAPTYAESATYPDPHGSSVVGQKSNGHYEKNMPSATNEKATYGAK